MTRRPPISVRLAAVTVEASELLTTAQTLRRAVEQIVKDWGTVPAEDTLNELRFVLEENPLPSTDRIVEERLWAGLTQQKNKTSREYQRRKRGSTIVDTFQPVELPAEDGEIYSPEEIESLINPLDMLPTGES